MGANLTIGDSTGAGLHQVGKKNQFVSSPQITAWKAPMQHQKKGNKYN